MAVIYHFHFAFDGKLTNATAEGRSPWGETLTKAKGLFETIRVLDGHPIFFAEHHARLTASCRACDLPWEVKETVMRERCDQVLRANACRDGSLKIAVFENGAKLSEVIGSRDPTYSEDLYSRGFRLRTHVDRERRPGAAHKCTNYLKNTVARENARAAGYDEALFVDEQLQLLEGSVSNIFVVTGERILTPPLAMGILPGVARSQILKRWTLHEVSEAMISVERLRSADEVFVTNALLGVMPVAWIGELSYSIDKYAVTGELRSAFERWQRSSFDLRPPAM